MHHPPFDSEVLSLITKSENKLVVVKFGANWCPPCVALAPQLELLAAEYAGNPNVVFASVDVDQCGGSA